MTRAGKASVVLCAALAGCHDPAPPAQPTAGGSGDLPPPTAPPAAGGVRLTGLASNAGWIVHIHLPEPARAIWYKRPTDADFVSTGDSRGAYQPGTGEPQPKSYVVLDDLRGRVPFAIRWQDLAGETKGPVEVVFDTVEQSVASVKSVLADLPAWLAFREYDGKSLVYFTTLVTYKYALREIRYGIDAEPNTSVRFTPADTPGIAEGDELYIALPPRAEMVTLELMYRDGSRSELKRYPIQRP